MSQPYFRATDPYPLEGADFNALHEFYDYVRAGRLVTTLCAGCKRVAWPPRRFCPHCLSDRFEWTDLPQEGTIHGFTIQEAGIPAGFKGPLIFAVVELAGLKIFSLLVETEPSSVKMGARVRFTTMAIPEGPGDAKRVLPAFTLTA